MYVYTLCVYNYYVVLLPILHVSENRVVITIWMLQVQKGSKSDLVSVSTVYMYISYRGTCIKVNEKPSLFAIQRITTVHVERKKTKMIDGKVHN